MRNEDLLDYLPEWKRQYFYSPTFKHLVKCFSEFISCHDEKKSDLRGALQIAYDNFNHLCETDPEGRHKKELHHAKVEKERREAKYKSLYENHLREYENMIQ